MITEPWPRYITGIFFTLICLNLYWGLGNYGLLHNNDGLYAEIALEMIRRQDYVAPYLNGVPYFEKPPLLYWLLAGSFKAFGVHEWSARVVTTTCGLLTVMVVYLSSSQVLSKRTADLSALIMGSSVGFAVVSRMIFFEMLLTLLISSTLLSYLHWHLTAQRKFLRLCYVSIALAILAKGFITVVLTGLVIIAFNIKIKRPLKLWWQDFDAIGFCLLILIAAPWHISMIFRDSHFAWFYFINEHVLRFLGQRQPKDYYSGPLYYYTYRVVMYLLPWSLLLSIFCLKISIPGQPLLSVSRSEREYKLFLIIWFLVFLVFFSLSRAKANYYMITAIPPLVILLSHRFELSMQSRQKIIRFLLQFCTLFFAGLALSILCIKYSVLPIDHYIKMPEDIQTIISYINSPLLITLVITGLFSLIIRYFQPYQIIHHVTLLGMTSALLSMTATHIAPTFENFFSSRQIVSNNHLKAEQTCYFRDYERFSSFTYYLSAPIPIIDSISSDLLYGQKYANHSDIFISSSTNRAYALSRCHNIIVANDKINDFQQKFNNYHEIFTNMKLSIFKKS